MKTKIAIFLLVGSSFCVLAQNGREAGLSFQGVSSVSRDSADSTGETLPADTLAVIAEGVDGVAAGGTQETDSMELASDSLSVLADSLERGGLQMADSLMTDSVAEDTAETSKSMLDQPVEYTASDSVTFEAGLGNANLYGNSKVNYTNLELQADLITMNLDSSIVHAVGRPDSTGKVQNQPVFKQGSDQYEPDKISYNFKTKKAFIDNVYTQQGDGFLISEESKRDAEGVMYVRHGKYTTCNAKHPHFYLAL